jgi:hypothetical protein
MKNKKSLRLQVQLKTERVARETWLNQPYPLAMIKPFFPARKIPVVHHPALEELLAIKTRRAIVSFVF